MENLDKLYICNIISKRSHKGFSDHCVNNCFCGNPHLPVVGKGGCSVEEVCDLHASGKKVKVRCRKLTAKEKKILRGEI